jgi:hypothetical protein
VNVIDSYLDTLFAPYPDSPRLREARAELRTMMEDAQDGLMEEGLTESQAVGRVIAEFGTLEEVAPVLGIDAELGRSPAASGPPSAVLDLDRARRYAEAVRGTQWMIALAVPLFVLCAVPLLVLIAVGADAQGVPANWAVATGIGAVLVLVTIGVLLLVARDALMKDFEDVDGGEFTAHPEVRRWAQELEREHRSTSTLAGAAAIVLWILCALPTILAAFIVGENSSDVLYGVSLSLVMVAVGLAVMIRGTWAGSAAGTLLQEDDADDENPERSTSPAIRAVAAVYWPVVVATYLAWSFLFGQWQISWVIWPVAGVLYAGLSSLSVALRRGEPATRHTGARAR